MAPTNVQPWIEIYKNIKNKKIYYVKVRGYRKENGVNLYGKWSKIKKVK